MGAARNRDVRAAPRTRAHHLRASCRQLRGKHSTHFENAHDVRCQRNLARNAGRALAADLRPEAKAKRKAELLRIIAAVAGCNYDDLRQRERIRKRKRIALSSAAAALAIVAIGVFAFQFHRTSEAALIAESKTLAAASSVQFEQGNRIQAIQTALEALPTSEADHSRPLVPEAQAALERALLVNPDSASPYPLSTTYRPRATFCNSCA